MSRRHPIPQRQRIFVGCEGESERSYAALLTRLIEIRHRRFHLDAVALGGGDPLAILESAERQIRRRLDKGPYAHRVIFLDADRFDISEPRGKKALHRAENLKIQLIWQNPCHEGLLLQHIPGCEGHTPPDANHALRAIQGRWPDYRKAMPAARLAERIDRDAVLRAASTHKELRVLLDFIDF